jgi:hypothetical protein
MIPDSPKERNPPFFLPAEKSTFDIFLHNVDTMKGFMFTDLQSGMTARANFLVAGALNTYTEVWGRLLEGVPEEKSKQCYESFFRRLGNCYSKLLDDGVLVYRDVRCGLVHSYAIGGTLSIVNMGTGQCGIEYDSGKYTFNIATYFDDFKKAVEDYITLLRKDMPVQNSSSPNFIGVYPVTNPLQVNLFEALVGKPTVL